MMIWAILMTESYHFFEKLVKLTIWQFSQLSLINLTYLATLYDRKLQ